jgi:hypothetical protein
VLAAKYRPKNNSGTVPIFVRRKWDCPPCESLKLSAAGLDDYWGDAGRWIRNQFAEGQLLRADRAYRIGAGGAKLPDASIDLPSGLMACRLRGTSIR